MNRTILPILTALICGGCTPPEQTQPPITQEPEPSAAESQPSSPQAQLDALDPRTPVPLQPMMAWHQKQNMQAHLVAIAQINGALATQDWEGVERAAARIGTSPSMKQMCEHMGAGAPGFTELAMTFHTRADTIKTAAQNQDTSAVLKATSHTIEACTSCHATYRQQIVDTSQWQALTIRDSSH